MDCDSAREGLWPPERPRLLEDEVADARAHVDECEECHAYFAQDRALLDLYDRVRRQPAPLTVRERVFDALAHARYGNDRAVGRRRSYYLMSAVALGLGLVASVLLLSVGDAVRGDPTPEADPGIFAEDYLRRAVGEDHIVSSDPVEVARFLRRELGRDFDLLRLEGFTLERAEVCLISGRRGALVVYRNDGATISHYLVPRADVPLRAPALAEYRSAPAGGRMPLVVWSSPDVEQALIGEVDAAELLRIAGAT